jgi:GGDEF domain-containing protein
MKPRIGLIADQPTLEELDIVLDRSRFDIYANGFRSDEVDAVLFVPGDERASRQLDVFAKTLDHATQTLPLLAALCPKAIHPGKIQPFVPVPNLSVFCQLATLRKRENMIQNEARLREETLAFLNIKNVPPVQRIDQKERILFLGEPSSFFLRCSHDLKASGKVVEAAITERTAFEALKTHIPDAFVFTTGAFNIPYELLDHIHGRPDLKDLPVIAIATEPETLPELGDRVSALITIGPDDTDNLLQVMSVLKRQSIKIPLQADQPVQAVLDRYSGVFNREFAEVHLKSQIQNALSQRDSHTIGVLKPFEISSGKPLRPEYLAKFAKAAREVMRREDFVARLDWENFLISLPGSDIVSAEVSIRRVRSLIETTNDGKSAPEISFRYDLKTLAPHHNPEIFWRNVEGLTQTRWPDQSAVA